MLWWTGYEWCTVHFIGRKEGEEKSKIMCASKCRQVWASASMQVMQEKNSKVRETDGGEERLCEASGFFLEPLINNLSELRQYIANFSAWREGYPSFFMSPCRIHTERQLTAWHTFLALEKKCGQAFEEWRWSWPKFTQLKLATAALFISLPTTATTLKLSSQKLIPSPHWQWNTKSVSNKRLELIV